MEILSDIDWIFDNIKPTTTVLTLFRGVEISDPTELSINPTFLSTSYIKEDASSFAGSPCCVISITVPPGSKVICVESISVHPDEHEVILDRKCTFSITGVKERTKLGEKTEIQAVYIPPNSIQVQNLEPVIKAVNKQLEQIAIIVDMINKDEFYEYNDFLDVLIKDIAININVDINDNMIKKYYRKIKQ